MIASQTTQGTLKTNKADLQSLSDTLENALNGLLQQQHEDGHWCFELEADCTIPAEYILMMHYLGEIDEALAQKIAVYIRARQKEDGGWPLYYGGSTDISCTVKAYYALKLAGDDLKAPHMLRAKRAVIERGGAAKSNVFTRIALAMFGQVPWRGVPFLPVEIVLFPRWFPLTLMKVSYWSRTVMVPLFILYSLRATAKNPKKVHVAELFTIPPEKEKNYFPVWSPLNRVILFLERIGFHLSFLIPGWIRRKAMKKAENWFVARLNGTSGLGAIFPAMVNAYEALLLLGYEKDHPYVKTAKEAIDKLLVIKEEEAYCQPCVSPVWDTLLAACALQETREEKVHASVSKALTWLQERQLMDGPGDWQEYNPQLRNGSWPFQYANDYYPDLDDTAFAAYAMYRSGEAPYEENILRAAEWLQGMQSRHGGFAAFDADNTSYYLNEIPFADHGALLDPPTSDVSARVLMLLGCLVNEHPEYQLTIDTCLTYLTKEQEADGAWFGRWGTNYIYGTWSVLMAFESMGMPKEDTRIQKAVKFLKSVQNEDGGWGEDNDTYYDSLKMHGEGYGSTAVHTAWALLGLMAAGEVQSEDVGQGIEFLIKTQTEDGLWYDIAYNAPGFPRVFYLKYHGYDKYFPFWALARYRNEISR